MGRGLSDQQRAILAMARAHRAQYEATAAAWVPIDERRARELAEDRYFIHVQRDWDAAIVPRFGNRVYCDLFRREVLSQVYGLAGLDLATATVAPAVRSSSSVRDKDGLLERVGTQGHWSHGEDYAAVQVSAGRALARLIDRGLLIRTQFGYNLTAAGLAEEQAAVSAGEISTGVQQDAGSCRIDPSAVEAPC